METDGKGPKDLFIFCVLVYMFNEFKKSMSSIDSNVKKMGFLKGIAVVFDVAVFSNRTALVLELPKVALVLTDSNLKIFGVAKAQPSAQEVILSPMTR